MTMKEFVDIMNEQTIRNQRVNEVKRYFRERRLGEGVIASQCLRDRGFELWH